MSRIFVSHSSADNAQAVALRDWLALQGWADLFLDLDPEQGIAPGERWEQRLNEAANRCEAVLFLVSRSWIASGWCRRELYLARHLNKKLFGILIEDLNVEEVPRELAADWQVVRLSSGRDHTTFDVVLPVTQENVQVNFSSEGLRRLKNGLDRAGLNARFFAWPPQSDPDRPPYCGLKPLESEDAGIYFGRDSAIVEALDKLRGLRDATPPRLVAILGASGAGKSSHLRAGLLPRLARDDRNFLALPVIRPETAVISGRSGLLTAAETACREREIPFDRAGLAESLKAGSRTLQELLSRLASARPYSSDIDRLRPPTVILAIDQGEELFGGEGREEAELFLNILRDLIVEDAPAVAALFTIRSDQYELLQSARQLEAISQQTLSLPPMPKSAYADVIRGPAQRFSNGGRRLNLDERMVAALLADVEEAGGKDLLPLLAFTLERLFLEYGKHGVITIEDYKWLGGISGSIDAAVSRALSAADRDPSIPKEDIRRKALLRRGLVPWLAGVDPVTGAPRRRIARFGEIPRESLPLINCLVDQRLLATDFAPSSNEQTIEPAHEALLRRWDLLRRWLSEDAELLRVLANLQNAARDWSTNARTATWLVHSGERLREARSLQNRQEYLAFLGPIETEYMEACRFSEAQQKEFRREKRALEVNQRRRYEIIVGCFLGALAWLLGVMIESSGVISMGGLLQPLRGGSGLQVGADLRGILMGCVLVVLARRQIPLSRSRTALVLILACLAYETTTYFDDFLRDRSVGIPDRLNDQIVRPLVNVYGLPQLAVFALLMGATGLARAFLVTLIPIYRRPYPWRSLAFLTIVGCAVGAARIFGSGFDVLRIFGDFVGFEPAMWFENLGAITGEIAGYGWEAVIGGALAYTLFSDTASRLRHVEQD